MVEEPARPRHGEARAAQENPRGAVAPLVALRTVLLFTLTDAFALVPEESLWVGYHLDKILAPLAAREPAAVPLAVRQEMLDGIYSRLLGAVERHPAPAAPYDPRVVQAHVTDWAAVCLHLVAQCYPLRPMVESAMHGQLVGLLRELGVGDPANPRGARYLPNDVRHRLARRDHDQPF